MSEMTTRAVQAILPLLDKPMAGDMLRQQFVDGETIRKARTIVRTVMEAMRVPTDAMIRDAYLERDASVDTLADVWRSMIDAALKA